MIPAEDRAALDRDGFVVKPGFLPEAEFRRLREEVLGSAWDALETREGPSVTRRIPLDRADLRRRKPALHRFISDERALALIRYAAAIGGEPRFAIQTIMTNPAQASEDPESCIHSDTFHPIGKAWLYLDDVRPQDNPLFYVPGSHRISDATLAWAREKSMTASRDRQRQHANGTFRVEEDELLRMALPRPLRLPVAANTLIVADTFGFHGRTPRSTPGLRMEIYASLRRNPFVPWLGLDPFSLPFVRDHVGTFSMRRWHILGRLGQGVAGWRRVGSVRVDAPPQI
jgi:hypothetical protein